MNTVFPLLQSRFLLYPFYCPFFAGESAGISGHPYKQITHLSRLCFEGPVTIIVGVSNLSSLNSPSRALSCLQIKLISCELQNIPGNTVIKNKILFLLILLYYYYYYYYYCNRHMAPAPRQPSVRCATLYKNVGQHWSSWKPELCSSSLRWLSWYCSVYFAEKDISM
jgi:hypothetical protein